MTVMHGSQVATALVGMPGLVVGAHEVIDGEWCQYVETTVDEVGCTRRRVQQVTLGHRGHKGDPLYRARRVLLCADERLSAESLEWMPGLLADGDPDGGVRAAWVAKELLRRLPGGRPRPRTPAAHRVLPVRSTPRSPDSPAPSTAGSARCSPTTRPATLRTDESRTSTCSARRSAATATASPTSPTTGAASSAASAFTMGYRRHPLNLGPSTTLHRVEPLSFRTVRGFDPTSVVIYQVAKQATGNVATERDLDWIREASSPEFAVVVGVRFNSSDRAQIDTFIDAMSAVPEWTTDLVLPVRSSAGQLVHLAVSANLFALGWLLDIDCRSTAATDATPSARQVHSMVKQLIEAMSSLGLEDIRPGGNSFMEQLQRLEMQEFDQFRQRTMADLLSGGFDVQRAETAYRFTSTWRDLSSNAELQTAGSKMLEEVAAFISIAQLRQLVEMQSALADAGEAMKATEQAERRRSLRIERLSYLFLVPALAATIWTSVLGRPAAEIMVVGLTTVSVMSAVAVYVERPMIESEGEQPGSPWPRRVAFGLLLLTATPLIALGLFSLFTSR